MIIMIFVQLDMVQEENESLVEKVMPTTFPVLLMRVLLAVSCIISVISSTRTIYT